MKLFCISDDRDILVGLRLSGIEGIALKQKDEIEDKIDEICDNKEIGVLVITKNIYDIAMEKINYIREKRNIPLVVQIPQRFEK